MTLRVKHVIGIDQSASIDSKKNKIGWCIFQNDDLAEYGTLEPDYPDFWKCRNWLRAKVDSLTDIFDGSLDRNDVCVAIETVWLGKNARLFQRLISVKEHFHAVASDLGCVYLEITPIESARVVGAIYEKGHRKEAVIEAVEKMFGLTEPSEHEADAIAIGYAAFNRLTK